MPGRTRWSSTNLLGPAARSRTIRSVHLSPTRSSARASGDHWSYGCRLGGGTGGMACLLTNSRRWRQNTWSRNGRFGHVDIGGMKVPQVYAIPKQRKFEGDGALSDWGHGTV